MQTITLSLYRFNRIRDRIWMLGQMALGRRNMARTPGCTFWKLFGSGSGEGFTPIPNTAVWAILACWEGPDGSAACPVHRRWAARADESCQFNLSATSARGVWSGKEPFAPQTDAGPGGLAVMTRATVRPRHALEFWRQEPAISGRIPDTPGLLFKIGVGEFPLVQQVTFSVWSDVASMHAFAHASGPHAAAVRKVRDGGWFAEELYARFRVTHVSGLWNGRPPLEPIREVA
ncbi:spheroidene monooxygenase [Palleronia caenipelagi]|uniref:Spheroidene monooxygenase n=1 Tax=Palleronia caenipelagi TaxID=2489174 RepID=A0A547Q929_9RHOB|nr:spheroidene monooxygenase [Palleronia caenipelagi]TRD22880.1 spheroidene monooxygenase [Palleronia caenipelagi]